MEMRWKVRTKVEIFEWVNYFNRSKKEHVCLSNDTCMHATNHSHYYYSQQQRKNLPFLIFFCDNMRHLHLWCTQEKTYFTCTSWSHIIVNFFDRLFTIVSHALTQTQSIADVFILKDESDVSFLLHCVFSPSCRLMTSKVSNFKETTTTQLEKQINK